MQKRIAIFFLFLFTVSFTEAGQLMKFPVLVSHYSAHIEREGEKGFFSFIKEHYLIEHSDDGDSSEDRGLPFKTMTLQQATNFLPAAFVVLENREPLLHTEYHLYHSPFFVKNAQLGVFHPPRPADA